MSAINSSTSSQSTSTSTTSNGLYSLTPQDFVKFMVTELQNQDPTNATDPNQLLTQISQIGQLQSSNTLQTDLTGLVHQNQISSSAALVGKYIQGTDANSAYSQGNVTGVEVTSTSVNLTLDTGSVVPLSNVSSITTPPASGSGSNGSSNNGSGSTTGS